MPAGGPQLHVDPVDDLEVYRVGFGPDPWRWTPWEYAPFTGRWDDPLAQYRALYVGTTAFACYVEVLACFRPDPAVTEAMDEIVDDPAHPTHPAGVVPAAWCQPRLLGRGLLHGAFVDVQHASSIACLRPTFLAQALAAGLEDFDGSVVRSSERRPITGGISRHLYLLREPPVDGITFDSRHGNNLRLLSIFERPASSDAVLGRTSLIEVEVAVGISADSDELRAALALHGLAMGRGDPPARR